MNKHFTDFRHFDGPTFYFPFATVFKIHTLDNQKEYRKQPAPQPVFFGDAFCVEGILGDPRLHYLPLGLRGCVEGCVLTTASWVGL